MPSITPSPDTTSPCAGCCTRREILLASGLAISHTLLGKVFPNRVLAQDSERPVTVTTYPRQLITAIESIRPKEPITFNYPVVISDQGKSNPDLGVECMLVQLGTRAGGGIGPANDIVAFSLRCTHMGGDLNDQYRPNHGLLVCDEHLTLFDLTRHGIVVTGHATESLPQIILEEEEGNLYAVAIAGLVYGYHRNPGMNSA